MIKNKSVKIKMFGTNIKYYSKLGFNCKKGNELDIPINLVNPNSHLRIIAICEICGKEKSVIIKNYWVQRNRSSKKIYTCHDCSSIKNKQTRREKYGDENFTNRKKAKETLLKKYGVNHISKIPGHYEKINRTMNKRYGKHFSKTPEFIKKFSKTVNNHFGVNYPMQSETVKKKTRETLKSRYGVENISQLRSNFEKIQESSLRINEFKDTGLKYQGSFELDFLEKFYDKIHIENAPSIKYLFEGKNHIYFPDFYIKTLNLIIEIKSSYFYNKDVEKIKQKEIALKKEGFNYLLILDKNYDKFIREVL
jgi:hypothetical protein